MSLGADRSRVGCHTRTLVCVCVCVMSPRCSVKATRSLDENFGEILRRSGAFVAVGLSSTHTGHTLEPAVQLPVDSRCHFSHSFVSSSIHQSPATFSLHWTPPVNTTLSPHPLGSLELAVGPYRHHSHQWLRRTMRSTWRTLTVIFKPLTPGLSGVGLASPPI